MARSCRRIVARPARSGSAAGRSFSRSGDAISRTAHPRASRRARAFKGEFAAIAGARSCIERGFAPINPTSGEPGACSPCITCSSGSTIGSHIWRLAGSDINYRRFFDINTLAGLRVEDAGTFAAIHALVRRLISKGLLHGLRLDHIDGLRDPHPIFPPTATAHQMSRRRLADRRFYVIAEKDPRRWRAPPALFRRRRYHRLRMAQHNFTRAGRRRGLSILDRTWRASSGDERSFEEIVIEFKRRVIATILSSEFTVLTRLLARIAAGHYSTRDYTAERLRIALELFVLHFPIYRTYLTPSGPSREDRADHRRPHLPRPARIGSAPISVFLISCVMR